MLLQIFRSIPYAAPVDGFKRWTDPEYDNIQMY